MKTEGNILTADEGKVLRRISDNTIFGTEIALGYTHYIGGEALAEPLLELPEHYEEIDEPVAPDTVLLDETTELVEELPEVEIMAQAAQADEAEEVRPEPRRVTVGDYLKLEKEMQLIKRTLGLI